MYIKPVDSFFCIEYLPMYYIIFPQPLFLQNMKYF